MKYVHKEIFKEANPQIGYDWNPAYGFQLSMAYTVDF